MLNKAQLVNSGKIAVPLGKRYSEVGVLRRDGSMLGFDREDGGRWRILFHRNAEHFLGRRVRVEGVRVAFDELEVERIISLPAQG